MLAIRRLGERSPAGALRRRAGRKPWGGGRVPAASSSSRLIIPARCPWKGPWGNAGPAGGFFPTAPPPPLAAVYSAPPRLGRALPPLPPLVAASLGGSSLGCAAAAVAGRSPNPSHRGADGDGARINAGITGKALLAFLPELSLPPSLRPRPTSPLPPQLPRASPPLRHRQPRFRLVARGAGRRGERGRAKPLPPAARGGGRHRRVAGRPARREGGKDGGEGLGREAGRELA